MIEIRCQVDTDRLIPVYPSGNHGPWNGTPVILARQLTGPTASCKQAPQKSCPSCDGQPNNHNKTIHYTQEVPVLQTQSIEFPNPMIAIIVIQFTIHLLTITITHTHTHTHILVTEYSHLDYSLTDQHPKPT